MKSTACAIGVVKQRLLPCVQDQREVISGNGGIP